MSTHEILLSGLRDGHAAGPGFRCVRRGNVQAMKWRYALLGWLTWKIGKRYLARRLSVGR